MLSPQVFSYRGFGKVRRLLCGAALLQLPLMLMLTDAQTARAQNPRRPASSDSAEMFGNRQFHMVATPSQRVVATLTDSYQVTHLQPCQWLIYAPDAPNTDDQSAVFSTLNIADRECRATTWSELDPSSRKLLTARLLDGDSGAGGASADAAPNKAKDDTPSLTTDVTYTALLYRRELLSGPPARTPVPLSASCRAAYTRASETIDFTAPEFQAWLDAGRLRRRVGERDLDFALRVFRRIRASYTYCYHLEQDRRASAVCGSASSDCGGLSQLFVAALRANDIPAVALCGRIARSAANNTVDGTENESPGNVHVKSQFWASGVGWVPVEMSGAVYDRAAPDRAYFGRSAGDFLTLSVGNDQPLSLGNGAVVNQRGMQGIRFWVWGSPSGGDSKPTHSVTTQLATCWSVRQLPISTQGRQVAEADR